MITDYKKNHPNLESPIYHPFFLHQGYEGLQSFREHVNIVRDKLEQVFQHADKPFVGKTPEEIQKELHSIMTLSKETETLEHTLDELFDPVLLNSLHISHEKSLAHLHCPPLISGVVTELMIGALNQSMDSWDQSPAATYMEEALVQQLARLMNLPISSDGVFTSGGTQSNYMGMLLARDAYCQSHWQHNVQKDGLPIQWNRMRILCSEEAHFSVQKSASQLGMGEKSVIPIPCDSHHRMKESKVKEKLNQLKEEQLLPIAIVATCGTTDFGSIDPLEELAEIAEEHNLWLHVDAAYGGGLIFSHSYDQKIAGLHLADSITLDFHKLCYQPISCGLFLLKDRENFRYLSHHADYLNPEEDDQEGIVNLVNKSVQTTRRFDALKVFVTLKTLGTNLLGSMMDDTIELTQYTAEYLRRKNNFVVENGDPELSTVVFQYRANDSINLNELNRSIQQTLFHQGEAVISKTSVRGKVYLKFTLLNPRTTKKDMREVIREIERTGNEIVNGVM